MVTSRYRLVTEAGEYSADSLVRLAYEVVRHRWWHFLHGDGWTD